MRSVSPMANEHSADRHRGFTLIEVMVAIALFGMAALAAVNAASSHLSSLSLLQQKSFAQYVASNRLARISLAQQWPLADEATGQATLADRSWHWRQQVTETVTPNVVALTIIVSAAEDGQELSRLTRYLRRPDQVTSEP